MTVLVTNVFLGLFGFYLVNDCIERDIRTGVGRGAEPDIAASSRVFGKE